MVMCVSSVVSVVSTAGTDSTGGTDATGTTIETRSKQMVCVWGVVCDVNEMCDGVCWGVDVIGVDG